MKTAKSLLKAEGVQFPSSFKFDFAMHTVSDIGIKVKPQNETLQFERRFEWAKIVVENDWMSQFIKPALEAEKNGVDIIRQQ